MSGRDCLMWLNCTPPSYSSTKLALNILATYKPIKLAAGVKWWWRNNWPVWVKWPVLARWQHSAGQGDSLAYLACFTMAVDKRLLRALCTSDKDDRTERGKDGQENKRYLPRRASFWRRILRRCRAEEEISYVYRFAAASSWHLPNTPSTETQEENWTMTNYTEIISQHTFAAKPAQV